MKGELFPWQRQLHGVSVDGVAPEVSQRTMGNGGPRLHWRYCVRKVEGEVKVGSYQVDWVSTVAYTAPS